MRSEIRRGNQGWGIGEESEGREVESGWDRD